MSWLRRLLPRAAALDERERFIVEAYRSQRAPDLGGPSSLDRFIVVDVETSGLDPRRDRLLSIGAVAVTGSLVRFDRSFEVVLRQPVPSGHRNILVHGIGGAAQLAGCEPARALADFLDFAGKAPLVGFDAWFDRTVIERAARPALGIKPLNAWLDLAVLLPVLLPARAGTARTLDDWARAFSIDNYARHDAVADALTTAQLLLVVLAEAKKQGAKTCGDLLRLEKARRWLGR